MFQHAYESYLKYASDYDELRPLRLVDFIEFNAQSSEFNWFFPFVLVVMESILGEVIH